MAWRTRWILYAVLTLIPVAGALGGLVLAGSRPPVYSAEARLSVVLTDLGTAEQMASNYSRYLTRDVVAADLEPSAAASLIDVSAGPIPDSNMIRVEATASSAPAAVAAAKAGTSELQARVIQLSGTAEARKTLAQYTRLSKLVAQVQERVNASGGRGPAYTSNAPELATLQAQADALKAKYQNQTATGAASTQLSVVQPATPTGDDRTSRTHIYELAGLGAGALVAYVLGRLLASVGPGSPAPARAPAGTESAPGPVADGLALASRDRPMRPRPREVDLNGVHPMLEDPQPAGGSRRPAGRAALADRVPAQPRVPPRRGPNGVRPGVRPDVMPGGAPAGQDPTAESPRLRIDWP